MSFVSPAKRYARALFNLAQENQSAESTFAEIKNLETLIEASEDLRQFLYTPRIPSDKRRDVIAKIFQGKVSDSVYRFLLLLESKRRLGILYKICRAYEELHLSAIRSVKAEISTSTMLTAEQIQSLTDQLTKKYRKTIVPTVNIDQTLLGGFKIKIDDLVYDYSVRSQLERFREKVVHHV